MTKDEAVKLILTELERAEKGHPLWPDCMARKAGYVCEEAMELLQACNDYEDSPLKPNVYFDDMRIEAIQTGAMAIRFLINM